jgi:hypothetical protein
MTDEMVVFLEKSGNDHPSATTTQILPGFARR